MTHNISLNLEFEIKIDARNFFEMFHSTMTLTYAPWGRGAIALMRLKLRGAFKTSVLKEVIEVP